MSLSDELARVRRMLSEASTTQWVSWLLQEHVLEQIERSGDSDLKQCAANLKTKFKAWTLPEQVREAGELFEEYGEAVALLELKRRGLATGLTVSRLSPARRSKNGLKTPDIECTADGEVFYVEVKVLDVVGGQWAAQQLVREAFDNEVELNSRLRPGVNFGRELEIAPLGNQARSHAEILDDYARRIAGNIKKKQLTVGPTFLLIIDLRIPLDCYEPCCLVPTYFDATRQFQAFKGECVSGDWWQVGFGQVGDLVLGHSEFEGKGNIQGRRKGNGILIDYRYLAGLSVLSGKLSEPEFRIHTLAQNDRQELDPSEFPDIDPLDLAYFFSDARNDKRNREGWRYQTRS